MARRCARARIAGFAGALVACAASGDEIRLANGDRISGEVKAMSAERLVLRTPYAGEIQVDWREVTSLRVARPLRVLLSGRSRVLTGTLVPRQGGGTALLDAQGRTTELDLADVRALNPEPHESGVGVGYTGRALVSAAYSRGNADSDQLHADGELNARARDYRYAVEGKIDRRYKPSVGERTAWLFGGNYDWLLDERRFRYARTSLEHDEAKDLERRAALGAGYGAELFDAPGLSLSVRGGVDYVVVERELAPGESYPALGWGVKATWAPWGPKVELFHSDEGFWNLSDTRSVVVRSRTGLRVPLVSGLNATAQLNVEWESRPAPGRAATDTTLLFGLDYKF